MAIRLYVVAKTLKTVYDGRVRKVFVFFLSIFIFSVFGYFSFPKVYAAITLTTSPNPICQDSGKYTLTFNGPDNTFVLGEDYSLGLWKPGTDPNNHNLVLGYANNGYLWKKITGTTTTYTSNDIIIINNAAVIGRWYYKLWFGRGIGALEKDSSSLLAFDSYVILPKDACELGLFILEIPQSARVSSVLPVKVRNIDPSSDYLLWFENGQTLIDGRFPDSYITNETIKDSFGNEKNIKTAFFSFQLDNKPGERTLCLKHGKTTFGFGKDQCEISLPLNVTVQQPTDTETIQSSQIGASSKDIEALFSQKNNFPNIHPPCAEFDAGGKECIAVDTAFGRISTEPQGFVKSIFSLVLGLSGGIALILIIISGYRFMTSGGNPEAVKAATGQLTSAIVGLLFIIFAFVILEIVGVDILQIPGFTP